MEDKKSEDNLEVEQNQLLIQLVLRVSALEQVLIRHNLIGSEELAACFLESAQNFQKLHEQASEEAVQSDKDSK